MQRLHLTISGDVQAVGFRFNTVQVAQDLGLAGWVRNHPDGSVEITAEGENDKLENLVTWAKKGPTLSRVDDIKAEWLHATGEFSNFEARL